MATTKGVAGMPTPGSSHAPDFNPKYPTELKDFLQEFEEHVVACGLDEAEKVLKEKILNSYSTTQLGKKYTTNKLAKFITKSANGVIDDETDLNAYYRQFWPITNHLVKSKKINTEDQDRYFWQGLPSAIPTINQAMEARHFVLTSEAVDSEDDDLILGKNKKRRGRGRKERRGDNEEEKDESDKSSDED
ncbi:hypothetical protein BYT27DRAFT_7311428 [Phlegmacium glaucopus]|nr:hypothetical protein BYT27DRAFT_7311428 [Phlegmacium glaucopus]